MYHGSEITVVKVSDSLAINFAGTPDVPRLHRILVITLDYSGSMIGSPIEYGRTSVAKALRIAVVEFDTVFLLMYNHYVEEIVVTQSNIDDMSLLVEGSYRGIRLYRDYTNTERWTASWKNMHKIMRSYRNMVERSGSKYSMTNDDWLGIFRWKQVSGGGTVLRQAGEFPLRKTR